MTNLQCQERLSFASPAPAPSPRRAEAAYLVLSLARAESPHAQGEWSPPSGTTRTSPFVPLIPRHEQPAHTIRSSIRMEVAHPKARRKWPKFIYKDPRGTVERASKTTMKRKPEERVTKMFKVEINKVNYGSFATVEDAWARVGELIAVHKIREGGRRSFTIQAPGARIPRR